MTSDDSPRILITRLSHIGDCIETVPVLNALRAHFPKAFIAWIVETPTDQLLQNHKALDQLIVVPRGFLKSPRTVWQLRHDLRSLRFSITIDPQSLTKSAIVAWLSGAGRRLGLARKVGRELAPVLNNCRVQPVMPHVVDRSLELLKPLGIHDPQVEFNLPEDTDAQLMVSRFVRDAHLGCGYAVINPGAGWRSRQWSSDRFGSVARHLGECHALPSVVTWAGDKELEAANRIVARSGGHALLAPKTSLLQLRSLLAGSSLFVGCDTGPMHLAVAVGVDCVVLHGTTRPEISGPYGPRHMTVQSYFQTGKRQRADNKAMMAIQSESVCEACDHVLARQSSGTNLRSAA